MPMRLFPLCLLFIAIFSANAQAHPAPFTYLDVRLERNAIEVSLVAHIFDVAHDLGLDDPSRLLDDDYLQSRRTELFGLFNDRLTFGDQRDGRGPAWSELRTLPERQSIRLLGVVSPIAGAVPIDARMFPYDAAHQTFVNVYENSELTLQAILDSGKPRLRYFPGSTQGILAVSQRFAIDGASHIITGPEHWLLLIGLVVLGGTRRQMGRIIAGFLVADVATTLVIMMNVAHPAAGLTDPALALSVVYVGADNLMVRGGRDMRPWIALAFGVLHGFWFGGALVLMDLPRSALGWSLVSFALGAAAAQTCVILALASAIQSFRRASAAQGKTIAVGGSAVVITGGIYLFTQRVFFPGGFF
jgi:hypothetical protein